MKATLVGLRENRRSFPLNPLGPAIGRGLAALPAGSLVRTLVLSRPDAGPASSA